MYVVSVSILMMQIPFRLGQFSFAFSSRVSCFTTFLIR
jgi:hypothetical protein